MSSVKYGNGQKVQRVIWVTDSNQKTAIYRNVSKSVVKELHRGAQSTFDTNVLSNVEATHKKRPLIEVEKNQTEEMFEVVSISSL